MKAQQLDPRWTAYALGEVDPGDIPLFEELLARNPAAREHIDDVKELMGLLTGALREPDLPRQLGPMQQACVLQAAAAQERPASARRPKQIDFDFRARFAKVSSTSTPKPETARATGIEPPPAFLQSSVASRKPRFPEKKESAVPFAVVAAAPAAPEIRLEVSSEVISARKQNIVRLAVAALLAGAIGFGGGMMIGGLNVRAAGDQAAIEDAHSLAVPIRKSQGNLQALDEVLQAATRSLYKEKKYPDKLAKELNGTHISFSASDLGGKRLHRLQPQLMRMILDYARDAQEIDDRRAGLASLFDARKRDISALLAQGKDPKIKHAVVIQRDRNGNAWEPSSRSSAPGRSTTRSGRTRYRSRCRRARCPPGATRRASHSASSGAGSSSSLPFLSSPTV